MLSNRNTLCALGCVAALLVFAVGAQAQVKINEVYLNNIGTDTIEFYELYGPVSTDLTGLTVIEVDGDSGAKGRINQTWSLSGKTITRANGLFVIGTDGCPNQDMSMGAIGSGKIQNGTGTFLLVQNYVAPTGNDLDTNDDGVADFVIGTIIDSVAVTDGGVGDAIYFGAPVIGKTPANKTPAGIARKTDGLDTDSNVDWCYTSEDKLPPNTGTGADGYSAASPGVENSYVCGLPAEIDQTFSLNKTSDPNIASLPITLTATSYSCVITELAIGHDPTPSGNSGGALIDPADSSTIASVPYTLKNTGKIVDFKQAVSATGWFQFRYKLTDGLSDSIETKVNIFIQDETRVVITEIMYDPANSNYDNASFDSDWEWIEISNRTSSAIQLSTLLGSALTTVNNFDPFVASVPANSTKVVIKPDRTGWTRSTFVTEWAPLLDADVIQLLSVGLEGEPRMGDGGDTLRLFDSDGALLDAVPYKNGTLGWPTSNTRSSIYLQYDKLNTLDNDTGSYWHLSVGGACGAYATPEDAGTTPPDSDIGSPAILPVQLCNAAPVAQDISLAIQQDTTPGAIITLLATDADGNPLTYTIVAGPASGTLTDPNNAEADVTAGGALAGSQVRYTPATGASGTFTFTYKVNDGAVDSNVATVTVRIIAPRPNEVVITEIMYNPKNDDTKWEWVEIHNLTDSPVTLKTLNDANNNTGGNLAGMTIAAHDTVVITKAEVAGTPPRTMADFVAEWAPLTQDKVLGIVAPAILPALNNTGGDTLTLIADDNSILDMVKYEINTNNWPASNGESSIYLKGGFLTTTDNDNGANWASSTDGVDGAYKSLVGGTDTTYDVGSPAILPSAVVNTPPVAQDGSASVLNESTTGVIITLVATDAENNPLTYSIVTGPASGTLTDPNNGEADVTAGGALAGNQVRYIPVAGAQGNVTFTFKANDGQADSNAATITVTVVARPTIAAAVSRKIQGTAGTFDIAVGGIPGNVECRKNGPTLLVVTFDQPIQQVSGTIADVTLSSGTVSSLTVAANTLEIAMSGATNPGKLTVGFPGIATAGQTFATVSTTLCVRVLYGDASNDGRNNVLDLTAVKPNVNVAVSAANFRCDVTGDGRINVLDMTDVKNNLNKTVGACP